MTILVVLDGLRRHTEIERTSPGLDWSEGAGHFPFSVPVERSPVDKAVLNSMTKTERRLVSETEREALVELDEDALLELHSRVRRARTKYVKNYRRAASARVVESGSRGIAYPKNQRDRDKAEVFELALARVSRQVEVRAKGAAAELRAERLQAARAAKATPGLASAPAPDAVEDKAAVRPRATKTTGGLKRDASTRAMGARRQAKRDSR